MGDFQRRTSLLFSSCFLLDFYLFIYIFKCSTLKYSVKQKTLQILKVQEMPISAASLHTSDSKKPRKRGVANCVKVGVSCVVGRKRLHKKQSFMACIKTVNLHTGNVNLHILWRWKVILRAVWRWRILLTRITVWFIIVQKHCHLNLCTQTRVLMQDASKSRNGILFPTVTVKNN